MGEIRMPAVTGWGEDCSQAACKLLIGAAFLVVNIIRYKIKRK